MWARSSAFSLKPTLIEVVRTVVVNERNDKMNCGAHIVKYILFLFNFLCLVAGVLLIVFGSLVLTNNDGIMHLPVDMVEFPQGIPIAAIVLGCVISLISFLGCCGACKENNCMTVLVSVFFSFYCYFLKQKGCFFLKCVQFFFGVVHRTSFSMNH